MMNTGVNQGSAKIYQFPAGGRAALGGRRYGEAKTELDRPAGQRSGSAATAGTTQAAIEDDKTGRDH